MLHLLFMLPEYSQKLGDV